MVDSGAADPVANPADFPENPVEESEGSKRGQAYYLADSTLVPNEGQQKLEMKTEEGFNINMNAGTEIQMGSL